MSGKFWASVTGKRVSQLIGEYVGQARFWGWGFMGGIKKLFAPPEKKIPPAFYTEKNYPLPEQKGLPVKVPAHKSR